MYNRIRWIIPLLVCVPLLWVFAGYVFIYYQNIVVFCGNPNRSIYNSTSQMPFAIGAISTRQTSGYYPGLYDLTTKDFNDHELIVPGIGTTANKNDQRSVEIWSYVPESEFDTCNSPKYIMYEAAVKWGTHWYEANLAIGSNLQGSSIWFSNY